MRSGTATTRRVRLVIVLSVAAAVTVLIGAILEATHQPAHMTRLGLDVAAAGVALGLVALVVFAIGGTGRSRSRAGRADHRRGAPRPEPAAASRGQSRSSGHGKDRAGPVLSRPVLSRPVLSRPAFIGPALRRPAGTPGATAQRVPGGRPC